MEYVNDGAPTKALPEAISMDRSSLKLPAPSEPSPRFGDQPEQELPTEGDSCQPRPGSAGAPAAGCSRPSSPIETNYDPQIQLSDVKLTGSLTAAGPVDSTHNRLFLQDFCQKQWDYEQPEPIDPWKCRLSTTNVTMAGLLPCALSCCLTRAQGAAGDDHEFTFGVIEVGLSECMDIGRPCCAFGFCCCLWSRWAQLVHRGLGFDVEEDHKMEDGWTRFGYDCCCSDQS